MLTFTAKKVQGGWSVWATLGKWIGDPFIAFFVRARSEAEAIDKCRAEAEEWKRRYLGS